MKKEELKNHMDEIIRLTFIRLSDAYKNQEVNNKKFEKVGGRLIFPSYNKKIEIRKSRLVFPSYYKEKEPTETRISEQELRFIFVEVFNAYCDQKELDLYYSVETPTKDTYINFADSKEDPMPANKSDDKKGRSAEFDLVIFDEEGNRRCLVEFKAKNAGDHDHWKDFVKLNNPNEGGNEVLRYFIEVIKSYNDNTIISLKGKEKDGKLSKNHTIKASFHCYALEGESKRGDDNQRKGEDISYKFID